MKEIAQGARQIGRQVGRFLVQVHRRVPPGLRTLLGLILIAGGLLGFLPILGFWMIPLGIAVIGLDVAPLVRVFRRRRADQRRKRSRDLR